jgi:hypothetical protein
MTFAAASETLLLVAVGVVVVVGDAFRVAAASAPSVVCLFRTSFAVLGFEASLIGMAVLILIEGSSCPSAAGLESPAAAVTAVATACFVVVIVADATKAGLESSPLGDFALATTAEDVTWVATGPSTAAGERTMSLGDGGEELFLVAADTVSVVPSSSLLTTGSAFFWLVVAQDGNHRKEKRSKLEIMARNTSSGVHYYWSTYSNCRLYDGGGRWSATVRSSESAGPGPGGRRWSQWLFILIQPPKFALNFKCFQMKIKRIAVVKINSVVPRRQELVGRFVPPIAILKAANRAREALLAALCRVE